MLFASQRMWASALRNERFSRRGWRFLLSDKSGVGETFREALESAAMRRAFPKPHGGSLTP